MNSDKVTNLDLFIALFEVKAFIEKNDKFSGGICNVFRLITFLEYCAKSKTFKRVKISSHKAELLIKEFKKFKPDSNSKFYEQRKDSYYWWNMFNRDIRIKFINDLLMKIEI